MFKYITKTAKDATFNVLRLCTNQYKCKLFRITNHIRRGQKRLLSNLWEDNAFFRGICRRMRSQLLRHRREFILCATGAYAYDWDNERISLKLMQEYINEISYCHKLINESIVCGICQKRQVIDMKIDGIVYCKCGENQESTKARCYDSWHPFIERKDIIIWRKNVPGGMFVYKVFGVYNDVSAEDFLHVQTDIDYRKKWDNTAVSLDIVDTDPEPNSNSHIIYWEMLWPHLFANRDYVYNRRFITDQENQAVVIVSRSTAHASMPSKQSNHRVSEYWSYMVIQSKTTLPEPGIEFVLTYFDNPGVSIPKAITSWVAMNGMPDFLEKLRSATIAYSETKIKPKPTTNQDVCWPIQDPGFEYPPDYIPIHCKPVCRDESTHPKPHVQPVSFKNHSMQENITEPITEEKTSKRSWWSAILLYYAYE